MTKDNNPIDENELKELQKGSWSYPTGGATKESILDALNPLKWSDISMVEEEK